MVRSIGYRPPRYRARLFDDERGVINDDGRLLDESGRVIPADTWSAGK